MILRLATAEELQSLAKQPDLSIEITSRSDPEFARELEKMMHELGEEPGERSDVLSWFDLRKVSSEFEVLIGPDEVVVPENAALLIIDYPLSNPCVRQIRSTSEAGMTRGEIVRAIEETYREIYSSEEASQSVPTPTLSERVGWMNRPASDGTFGIWGHDFDDLGVESVNVFRLGGMVWLWPEMVS